MAFQRKADPIPVPAPAARMAEAPQPARFERTGFAAPAQAQPPATEQVLQSVIGNDLSIEGETITIRCKGSLKILGHIQADLHSKQLEVGRDAVVTGAIAADIVDVYGRVEGAILGARVILHTGADVEGDIMSQLLSVEEGANFDGRSKRVTNPADIAPQLERRPGPAMPSSAKPLPQIGLPHPGETGATLAAGPLN